MKWSRDGEEWEGVTKEASRQIACAWKRGGGHRVAGLDAQADSTELRVRGSSSREAQIHHVL